LSTGLKKLRWLALESWWGRGLRNNL
jgi:hypothetical protein